MIIVEPVKCPKCGAVVVADKQSLTGLYLSDDIKCPVCGAIVVAVTKVVC